MFSLDDRLANDTIEVCHLQLSYVGLLNDERFPWLVIVPKIDDLTEVVDLDEAGRAQLWAEVDHCCKVLQELYPFMKINIGALGNIVRQLHIHVIARHEGDVAWPGPVWGVGDRIPYDKAGSEKMLLRLREKF